MKYRHISVIKEWAKMLCDEECVWLDEMSDSGWELVSSQFLGKSDSADAPHYLTSDEYAFRYVFRTPRKKK